MGGTSTSNSSQQTQTSPWDVGTNIVNQITGQLSPMIANSGLNSTQTNALNSVEANAAGGNPYTGQIAANATSLLNGGGALNNAGAVNQNYQNYQAQTNPLASNTNYNPMSTPGFSDAINALTSNITNGVNGQFAAAGRDMSPANSQALGLGLTQGIAPVIQAQYNQNVQNQQGAANNLFNGGMSSNALLSGMQQQAVANQQQGTQASSDALSAGNYQANQDLAAEAQRTGIPIQTLGLLSQIGIPIAGLGTNSSGTSSTTNDMSGAQQFATIASGIASLGNMFAPKAPVTPKF